MEKVELRKHRPYCTIHNKSKYSEKYDSYYCIDCNRWIEPKCSDPNCEFCKDRPDKPQK